MSESVPIPKDAEEALELFESGEASGKLVLLAFVFDSKAALDLVHSELRPLLDPENPTSIWRMQVPERDKFLLVAILVYGGIGLRQGIERIAIEGEGRSTRLGRGLKQGIAYHFLARTVPRIIETGGGVQVTNRKDNWILTSDGSLVPRSRPQG